MNGGVRLISRSQSMGEGIEEIMDFSMLKDFQWSKERRCYVVVVAGLAVIGLVVLAIGVQLVRSAHYKIEKLNQQIEYEKNRNILLEKLKQIQGHFEQYKVHLPSSMETTWLMKQVTELVKSVGLEIRSLQPEPVTPTKELEPIAVRLVTESSYHQLGALVEKIENFPVFLRIHQLTLEKMVSESSAEERKVTAETGKGQIEMVIHTFLLKD